MKTQKALAVLATVSMLGLSVACNGDKTTNDRYQEGFTAGKSQGYKEGYDVGYDDGYADGDDAGYERAKSYFASADYLRGFDDGKAEGTTIGYNNGYSVGKKDGETQGYNNGYNAGKNDGYNQGKNEGYNLGYDDGYDDGYWDGGSSSSGAYTAGYNAGYSDGQNDGYDMGYDDGVNVAYDMGYDDGFDDGYDMGYYDGYGLSVGKTPRLKGYADVLSAFHNDLIDYSKIKMPVQTKRGLVANGKLLLSESSQTNKDTLKRTAAVEQYLVVEMSKQIKGKFGLSAERSLKVAKAANHFRKFSTKRALTAEDTNAYASEIVGVSFSEIGRAYESTLKGDLGAFQSVMEKAAQKNEVSPEKMAAVVTQLFI